jgi:hypothetical protein
MQFVKASSLAKEIEMRTRNMLTASLIALLAVRSGYGQPRTVKATIPFPFTVEGKVLAAGEYTFARNDSGSEFTVTGTGKNLVLAPILTRINGVMDKTQQHTHLVFDVVGDTHFLSEIWIPGEDGYVMLVTKGEHTHKVIHAQH